MLHRPREGSSRIRAEIVGGDRGGRESLLSARRTRAAWDLVRLRSATQYQQGTSAWPRRAKLRPGKLRSRLSLSHPLPRTKTLDLRESDGLSARVTADAGRPFVVVQTASQTRTGGGQFPPNPLRRPSNERHPQMTPSDHDNSNTPQPPAKGTGSPSPFLITVTKEGHLVARLPLSLFRFVWTGLGLAGWATHLM